MDKKYSGTHPWISFDADLEALPPKVWLALGEAQSKCQHLSGIALTPNFAHELHQVYLAKGVLATTAIEGNTLTEEQARAHIDGSLELSKSKAYLGQEIQNVVEAANTILCDLVEYGPQPITTKDICEYNEQVLLNLELSEEVTPGSLREHSVTVARYQGAPAEDCAYLLDRLCLWMNSENFDAKHNKDMEIAVGILKAILCHLYIAWIHPFGDGNGRTARMLEVRILLEAGVPSVAAHLLSNFYNETRSRYYRELDNASKSGGKILNFVAYAVEGFSDQLRTQIEQVKGHQLQVAWVNYVHEQMRDSNTHTGRRQRELVLALSSSSDWVRRADIRILTPQLADMYAGKKSKTISRDINELVKRGLIQSESKRIRAKIDNILAFLPLGRDKITIKP